MADLNALSLFAKVREAGSFSEAARRLKMPVSSLSRRIMELEGELGVRLLERTTRQLRLTNVGAEVLELAQRGVEVSDAVDGIVSHHLTEVCGTLRLAAPPSISDSVLAPLVTRFQAAHPQVRVRVLITERDVDPVAEAIDLAFRVGPPAEAQRPAQPLLTYRHLLVASPAYLTRHAAPQEPDDLPNHNLLAFARGKPSFRWTFLSAESGERRTLTFEPRLAMNDYSGLAAALLAGAGIGDLPPIVLPKLLAKGKLVEVMPEWRFRPYQLTLVPLGERFVPRPVRLFERFAAEMLPSLFPNLPQ